MLEAFNISINFGGVQALQDVSVAAPRSSVTSIVGPNGAGKTTLFNCLTGHVKPQAGVAKLDGKDVTALSSHLLARSGISRAFQTPRVEGDQNVLGATQLGAYSGYRPSTFAAMAGMPVSRRRERQVRDQAMTALERVGMAHLARRRAGELSLAHLRLLEVARAITGQPLYVLLDEPAAGLTPADQQVLAATLQGLSDDGLGVLLIEHNIEFVVSVSESVTVLHRGAVLHQGSVESFRSSAEVRDAFVGTTAVDAETQP